MDTTKIRFGEAVAAVSALLLFIIMFLPWYGYSAKGTSGLGFSISANRSAWQAYGFIDLILFVTIIVALGMVVLSMTQRSAALPVSASVVVAILGGISVLLILGGIFSSTRQAIKDPAVVEGETLYIYPEQYEGQEYHPLLFCTGAVPAQQVEPLIPWVMQQTGARTFYLPSADYIWPHVMNRKVHEVASANGGKIVGEVYFPIDHADWGETVDDMAQNFPWQFAGNFQKWVGRWNDMPVDAHMLIALSASTLPPSSAPLIPPPVPRPPLPAFDDAAPSCCPDCRPAKPSLTLALPRPIPLACIASRNVGNAASTAARTCSWVETNNACAWLSVTCNTTCKGPKSFGFSVSSALC